MVLGALPAALLRRWWLVAAAAALVAGTVVGFLHERAVPVYSSGSLETLTVELTTAPRISHGKWSDGWYATGSVIAGAPTATVALTGSGAADLVAGDTVTARVRVAPATRPGQAASLRVLSILEVGAATDVTATVRMRMRKVAGDGDAGWLLSGMTLGMDQGLSEGAAQAMQDSGLTHLTAVSGANCAVLLAVMWWVGGWIGLKRGTRVAASAAVLAWFVAVVGPEPSVLRASTMAGLAMAAALVGGRRAAAHLLQVAVIGLLLIDPWLAYSAGFMLSIAATAGLIALIDRGPLAATVAAQVATMPILLALGASVGPQSVVANVLVTPLVAVIPVIGLLSLIAAPLAQLGRWGCEVVLGIAHWDPFGPLAWPTGWPGVVLAAVVCLVILMVGRRRLVPIAAVLIGAVSLTVRLADPWPVADWWLVACDVGQGDGFVLRDGAASIVVDTGPDPQRMDQCLERLGVRDISLLVLTHFHDDHVGGLEGVLQGRLVGQVWISPCREPADTFAEAVPDLAGMNISQPTPGTVASVGSMTVTVVWPQRIIQAGSVPNNASITFVVNAPHGSAAFFGDVEEEAQRAMLNSGAILTADVVKVPHHGSAGFDADLPAAVRPRIALVGVGENSFGHPTPEAVAAWQQVGAQVYTTRDNGDIALTPDGVVTRGVSRSPER
jgi:competence protein ComEC